MSDVVKMLSGDCARRLRSVATASIDAVVTDPPYEIALNGHAWDATGIAFSVTMWAEVLRTMKRGAYLLAFGGTRTFHRMTSAIEDAGFQIQDVLSWNYNNGFPKHHSKLKPAWEPIVMARKPAPKATLLAIDECRDNGRWPANVLFDEAAADLLEEQITGTSRFFLVAKATPEEKDAGLDDRHFTPRSRGMLGQLKQIPPLDRKNFHPTVKPIALMRRLVRLVTPKGGRVLDPFAGSGTTGCAAVMEGASFVGIEQQKECVRIARARIRHWAAQHVAEKVSSN